MKLSSSLVFCLITAFARAQYNSGGGGQQPYVQPGGSSGGYGSGGNSGGYGGGSGGYGGGGYGGGGGISDGKPLLLLFIV